MMTSTAYPINSSTNYQTHTPSNMVYSADGRPIPNPQGEGTIVPAHGYKNHDVYTHTPVPTECAPPTALSGNTIVHPYNNAVAVVNPRYVLLDSRKPVTLTYCPHCAKQNITTHTRTKVTGTTWGCVAAGAFIFWPLCWLPLVIKPMKQTNHYCTSCGVKVGRVKPFN